MKRQNKRRSEQNSLVRLLEKGLSLRESLFSKLALRRGMRRLRRIALIVLCAVPVLIGIFYGINSALDAAYSLNMEHISYKSRRGLISKEQALHILGIEGKVNLAVLDVRGMQEKLEAIPGIDTAIIRAELPDTLHIEVDERIPIVFVEMESGASAGRRTRLFMDPKGVIFPVNAEYHRNFMGLPTWYLQPSDIRELVPGARITEERCRPIRELAAASNNYDLTEIPAIREIFRPKEWKILVTLDNGAEVCMQVYEIKEQLERLAMILEHARATGHTVRSVNVIPRINPTVVYADDKPMTTEEKPADEQEKAKEKPKEKPKDRRRR